MTTNKWNKFQSFKNVCRLKKLNLQSEILEHVIFLGQIASFKSSFPGCTELTLQLCQCVVYGVITILRLTHQDRPADWPRGKNSKMSAESHPTCLGAFLCLGENQWRLIRVKGVEVHSWYRSRKNWSPCCSQMVMYHARAAALHTGQEWWSSVGWPTSHWETKLSYEAKTSINLKSWGKCRHPENTLSWLVELRFIVFESIHSTCVVVWLDSFASL